MALSSSTVVAGNAVLILTFILISLLVGWSERSLTTLHSSTTRQGLLKIKLTLMDASELESIAHQHHDDQHLINDKEMVAEELPKVRNTKEDSFSDFTVNDSCDPPSIGESGTESQAQGSKAMNSHHLPPSVSSGKTSCGSKSPGTGDNTSDWFAPFLFWGVLQLLIHFFCWSRKPSAERIVNMRRANMLKSSSWITALTFPLCLFLANYRHPPFNEQRSSSIWLALLGMLNLTAFLSSLSFMVISGAHFTRMQITALVISAMLMNTYTTGSTVPFYVSVLGMLFAGSFVRA